MATEVRALQNFDYPKDLKVRDSIAAFHKIKKNDGISWPGDRGENVEVSIGEVVFCPDDNDYLDHWLTEGIAMIPLDEEADTDG